MFLLDDLNVKYFTRKPFQCNSRTARRFDARCFPLKENKDKFIFEFCSPMNFGMYILNKLFHG